MFLPSRNLVTRLKHVNKVLVSPTLSCKRFFKANTKNKLSSTSEFFRVYKEFQRSVRFILVDDQPIDRMSYFNQLQCVKDMDSNVVATSCQLLNYLHKYGEESALQQTFDSSFTDVGEDASDYDSISDSEIENLSNTILPLDQFNKSEDVPEINVVRNVFNSVIEDKEISVLDWNQYFDDLRKVCSDCSLSLLHRAMIDFFIDIAKLKEKSALEENVDWITLPLVQSFVRYLLEDKNGFQQSQPALFTYLSYCLNKNNFKAFYKTYQEIKPKVKVYNEKFLNLLVKGLSKNQHLDEAKDLLVLQKLYIDNNLLYNAKETEIEFGNGCFASGDVPTAIKIMISNMKNNGKVSFTLLKAFLNHFSFVDDVGQWKENHETVMAFFNYLKQNEIFLDAGMISCIVDWFSKIKSESWNFGKFQNFQVRFGVCPITKIKMRDCELTSNEFEYLEKSCSQILLKNAIEGDISLKYIEDDVTKSKSNLTHQSSVKDIRKFLEYLYDEGPFDLIVDGMNNIYMLNPSSQRFFGKHRHQKALTGLKNGLINYRDSLNKPDLKICVIFRQHVLATVREDGNFLFDVCNLFFANSKVSDDILLLYSSMVSGPNCYFASRDLFRDYRSVIANLGNPKLTRLFDKYQCSRQIYFKTFKDKVYLNNSHSLEPEIKFSKSSWHFPYFNHTGTKTKLKGNLPSSWLCVTKGYVPPHFKYEPVTK